MDITQADKEFRNIGDVDYDKVIAPFLTTMNSPMLATARATHVAAQPMTALFWAQGKFENQEETTGQIVHPSDHNPVTLRPWVDGNGKPCDPRTSNGLPPGAVGIITAPNGTFYLQFGSDAACAAEWKHRLTDPSYKNGVYTGAHTLKDMLNIYCPPGDKHAITGDDANAAYEPAVMATLKQFAAPNGDTTVTSPPPPASGGTPVAQTYTVAIPGLPGGPVELPFPLDTKTYMIPASNTYQNPGIKLTPPYRSVQHGTGNANSLARSDANWVANDSAAEGFQESMHFEIDDTEGFQLIVGGDVSWQAADGPGPGNMSGWSCEVSENAALWADPVRRRNAIRNCAVLMGTIAARVNIDKPERHWDFNAADPNRHHCPEKLMTVTLEDGTLAWDLYVTQWNAAKQAELARMSGQQPTPQPVPTPAPHYTPASKPTFWDQLQKDGVYIDHGTVWFSSHESYTAQNPTDRFTYAAAASTQRAGAPLKPGDVVNPDNDAIAVGTSGSGGQWVIDHAPNFTRFNLADLKP